MSGQQFCCSWCKELPDLGYATWMEISSFTEGGDVEGRRVRLQSNIMPRFRAVWDGVIVSSPVVNEEVGGCFPCVE